MSNREQTQADLLDQFRQGWTETPPDGLDAGVAAMAVMLDERLSPPTPSARFVQALGRRLEAETSHSNNHRPAGVLPLLPDQTIPPSPPANDWQPGSHDEPRRPWFLEVSRIAAVGLAIALVGALLLLLFRDADDVAAPGAGETVAHPGEILVSWDPNGGEDYKLFIVDTAGGEPRKLTPGPAEADGVSERSPAWSPDGRQIAFIQTSGEGAGSYKRDLHIMDADGSNLRNLSEMVGITQVPDFSWSPDGSQITFSGSAPGPDELYVVNADGSNLRQLTEGGIGILGASWSPDGSQIAFVSQAEGRYGSIYLVNADGTGNMRSLTDQVGTYELHWSPDSSRLAFTAGRMIDTFVFVVNSDGSNLRRFTDTATLTSARPRWSPDGESIAFVASDGNGSARGTYLANPDGSDWRPLTSISGAHEWSPDGDQLAILTSGLDSSGAQTFTSTLYVLDADGSNLRPLIEDASLIQSPAWRPPVTGDPPPIGPMPTPITPTETEAPSQRLYVVTSNGVAVLDAMSNQEIYSIDAINPDAALSPDGSRLYVLGAGDIFQLTAFDTTDGTELWSVPVEDRIRWIGDHGPSTLAVSPDGNQIFIASSDTPEVMWIQVLDANTGTHIGDSDRRIGYCSAMLRPAQDGNNLFLVCQRGGKVTAVDLHALTLNGGGEFGGANVGAVMSPDGSLLYIVGTDNTGYGVTLINTADRGIAGMHHLADGETPPLLGEMVAISLDGTRLYVAIGAGYNAEDASPNGVHEIAVFDTTSWAEIDRIALDVPLKGGTFTTSSNGHYLYASERLQTESDGKLIRIDVESGETGTVLVRNAEILRVLTTPPRQSVDPAPPIPPVEQEEGVPPQATLAFGDGSQVGVFSYGCGWPPEDTICTDPAGMLFPEQGMQVLAGTELTFSVDGMSDLVAPWNYAYPLNDEANVEPLQGNLFLSFPFPLEISLPTSEAPAQLEITADLPPGNYAIAVNVSVPSGGSATYGFHIAIADETETFPPGFEIEPFDPDEFDRYPVWSLGETFGEFVLDRVHHNDTSENDSVEYSYIARDGRAGEGIVIISEGPLSETELQAREESRQGLGEPVVVNGVDGWITPVDDRVTMLEINWSGGGQITIYAPDRATAIAVAESVYWVNAS